MTIDFPLAFALVIGLPPPLVCCAALVGYAVRGIWRVLTTWQRHR
jgi:hypothetical protein